MPTFGYTAPATAGPAFGSIPTGGAGGKPFPPMPPPTPAPAAPAPIAPPTPAPQVTNPESFKQLLLAAHPNDVANDGRRYADIPAEELVQKAVANHPNDVTKDGRKYSDFLPPPTPPPLPGNPLTETHFADMVPHTNSSDVNLLNPISVAGHAIGNIPHEVAQGLENIGNIPAAIYSTLKDKNVQQHPLAAVQGAADPFVGIAKQGVSALGAVGNTVLGGVQAGIKGLTGHDLGDTAASQAYRNKLELIGKPVEGFTKGLIDNPLATIGATSKGISPKGDSITTLARPVIDTTKTLAKQAVAPIAEPIANTLRTSAEESVQKALGATTNKNKAIAANLAPQILARPFSETSAFSRTGLEAKAAEGKAIVGEGYNQMGPLKGSTPTQPIVDALEKEKAQFMAGGKVVDEAGYKQVESIQKLITDYGDTIDNQTLREVRHIFDKQVERSKGGFALPPDEGTALDVKRSASNVFRKTLGNENPDFAALNKQYTFWSNLEKVIGDTNKRTAPQTGFGKDLATLAGAASGHGVVNIALKAVTFRWLSSAMKSTGWRLTSARIKNSIADSLSNGDFKGTQKILKDSKFVPPMLRLPAPPEPPIITPPPPDTSGIIQSSKIGPQPQFNPRLALPAGKPGVIGGPTRIAGPAFTQEAGVPRNQSLVPKSELNARIPSTSNNPINKANNIPQTLPQSGILDKAKNTLNTIKKEGNKGFVKIPGMRKFPEPPVIAKKLEPVDANKVQQYLNTKATGIDTYVSPDQSAGMDSVLEKLGLQKGEKSFFSNEKEKISYLQSVVDHFNDKENKGSVVVDKANLPKPKK